MEAESGYVHKAIVPEGESPTESVQYISPDVAAAMAGEAVDFSMHLDLEEPVEVEEPEPVGLLTQIDTDA